jgi:hypothetical protein
VITSSGSSRGSGSSSGSGSGSSGHHSVASAYSVEHQGEIALDRFLSSETCRREVLAKEFDEDL